MATIWKLDRGSYFENIWNKSYQKLMQFDIFVFVIKARPADTMHQIAILHSLIQAKEHLNILLYSKDKNIPIFFTMQVWSDSSQPFIPLFWLWQLNERDAKDKVAKKL